MDRETMISHITDTGIALLPAIKGIARQIWQENDGIELRPIQVMILDILHHDGAISMSGLSETLAIANANTTPLVNDMLEKGLIRRTKRAEDKRLVLIEMTPEGEALQKRLFDASVNYVRQALNRLETEELLRLDRALDVILDVADQGKAHRIHPKPQSAE